jgi:hypothetical protein
MKQEDIIRMTREASANGNDDELTGEAIERFFALAYAAGAAAEREACAKVCESYLSESPHSWGGTTMAAAIRARGNA